MDQKYLAEIRMRCEAATPGPWEEKTNYHPQRNGEPWGWISGASGNITWSGYVGKTNADFIAHARTDIPTLISEVERLNAEIATLKKEIEQLAEERDAAKRKKDELEAFYEQLCRNIAQEASK